MIVLILVVTSTLASAVWIAFVLRELCERRPNTDLAQMRAGQYLAFVFHTLWVWGLDDTLQAETKKASPVVVRRLQRLLLVGVVLFALLCASTVLVRLGTSP